MTTIYLNSGNLSLLPQEVLCAQIAHLKEFEINPTQSLAQSWGKLWEVQQELARFLDADPQDLFLRENVTSVLNTVLLNVPLPKESEILVGELEYGAVYNICRMRAERDGLNLRVLKLPQSFLAIRNLSMDDLLEHIISQFSPQTKLVVLSHVIAGTGMVLPIQQIAKHTIKSGVIFAVDGAYAPGALPISFSELGDVDFYGCSLYKWMLGPKGTGFGWVAKRWQDLLEPQSAGWTTFSNHGPFLAFGGGSRFQEKFLLQGCRDFSPFFALKETLSFWHGLGAENVRRQLLKLQQHLSREVSEKLGWPQLASLDERLNGPLLAFQLPANWQKRGPDICSIVFEACHIQINTVCLRGAWHGVFSPHIYNSCDEISEAIGRLQSLEI